MSLRSDWIWHMFIEIRVVYIRLDYLSALFLFMISPACEMWFWFQFGGCNYDWSQFCWSVWRWFMFDWTSLWHLGVADLRFVEFSDLSSVDRSLVVDCIFVHLSLRYPKFMYVCCVDVCSRISAVYNISVVDLCFDDLSLLRISFLHMMWLYISCAEMFWARP